jgi:hypothetical protein
VTIIIRRPWTRQPVDGTPVSWGSQKASGLMSLQCGWSSQTLGAFDSLAIEAGSPGKGTGNGGRGLSFSGGAQRFVTNRTLGDQSGPFSIEVLCSITACSSLAGFAGLRNPSSFPSGATRALLGYSGANSRNIYFWGNSADVDSGVEWGIDGSLQHVVVTSGGSGTPMVFYRNRTVIYTGTTPTLITVPSTELRIGDIGSGWSASPTGIIFYSAYHARILSFSDVSDIWRSFAPRQVIIPSAAAAAGTYTLSNATMYQLTSTTGYPRVDVTVT